MKIAMVSEHADPLADIVGPDRGGQNVHVAGLSAALTRRGHDVTVYTRRDCAGPRTRVAPEGYRVVRIDAGPPERIPKDEVYDYLDILIDGLSAAFAIDRPDVVHAHYWMSAIASELAAFPERLPVVVTFHALGSVERRFLGSADTSPTQRIPLETVIGRRATAIVATCTDEVRELHDLGVSTRRVKLIPSGVDVDEFGNGQPQDQLPREMLPPRGQRRRIATVGNMTPRKGLATVLAALADIPDAELIVVGGSSAGSVSDDPEAAHLIRCAAEYSVSDRVHFVGSVAHSAMPAILADADVVACVPWYEPFGVVPLEAMAAGTAVVASAVGGILDTVVPGVTGELVPPRDPAALAETLRSLLADDVRLRSYGDAGRRRADERYRWSKVALETERLYRRLCEQRQKVGSEVIGHAAL
ncbi:glycosyltransferase family 1 protein [Gordonia sp. TBRC 11910]|uniref:Glycosyltransferase family 1 protein n=1 Tax=Gordonia asplenii TaxID=2725283 RepID=A0A848L7C9_9ACTN|nr:glycosyltransferase [Gordonia asplenii]NMO04623.1 glycosyltransferase family 1 protein [Gordonia asplenii]